MTIYPLWIGDSDKDRRWGGQNRPAEPAEPRVRTLQENLQKLGFAIARTGGEPADTPGVFGYWTAMAVREFQSYAKLARVAADPQGKADVFGYVSITKPAADLYVAAAHVSGVANLRTQELIQRWMTEKWRCPVVVCGFTKKPEIKDGVFLDPVVAKKLLKVANVWTRYDAVNNVRVYCTLDFSAPIGTLPAVEPIGDALPMVKGSKRRGGPRLQGVEMSDPGAAVTPISLTGSTPNTPAAIATYKVVHSIAHVETSARFDAVNGWDDQVLSFGPYQFVLTATADTPVTGELPAFFAMMMAGSAAEKAAFAEWFGELGLSSAQAWADIKPNSSQRVLVTTLALRGPMVPSTAVNEADFSDWPNIAAAKEPLRDWHLFRRMVLAARRSTGVRAGLWRFCRYRIRNLLSTPWGAPPAGYAWPATTTLGDVFRSEAAAAVLLRLHVKSPALFAAADAHSNVAVRTWLVEVIEKFNFAGKTQPPLNWQMADELDLLKAMLAAVRKYKRRPAQAAITQCHHLLDGKITTPLGPLTRTRDFTLDARGL